MLKFRSWGLMDYKFTRFQRGEDEVIVGLVRYDIEAFHPFQDFRRNENRYSTRESSAAKQHWANYSIHAWWDFNQSFRWEERNKSKEQKFKDPKESVLSIVNEDCATEIMPEVEINKYPSNFSKLLLKDKIEKAAKVQDSAKKIFPIILLFDLILLLHLNVPFLQSNPLLLLINMIPICFHWRRLAGTYS